MKTAINSISPANTGGKPVNNDALAGLLSKATPAKYPGVFFMLLAFSVMSASIILFLFVDSAIAFLLCLLLYLTIAILEFREKIYSPITISLVVLYIGTNLLNMTDSPYLPYSGLTIFAWLSVLCITLLVMKKPMTTFYTNGLGQMKLHYLISSLWAGGFILSFLAAWLLMPSIWYLIVPFIICASISCTTLYLTFFDKSFITKRDKEFVHADITVKQLVYPSKDYDEYIDFYSYALATEVYESEEKVSTLKESLRDVDTTVSAERVVFGAYHHGKLIGTIGVAFDGDGKPFPFEEDMGLCADPMRKLGRIATIGRFGIAREYRERPEVIRALFKALLELALERDVAFVIAEIFPPRAMVYARLGFTSLYPRSDPKAVVSHPVMGDHLVFFCNISEFLFFRTMDDKINTTFGFFDVLNPYLIERYIKRMTLKHFFASPAHIPWMHTIGSIRHILGIASSRRG